MTTCRLMSRLPCSARRSRCLSGRGASRWERGREFGWQSIETRPRRAACLSHCREQRARHREPFGGGGGGSSSSGGGGDCGGGCSRGSRGGSSSGGGGTGGGGGGGGAGGGGDGLGGGGLGGGGLGGGGGGRSKKASAAAFGFRNGVAIGSVVTVVLGETITFVPPLEGAVCATGTAAGAAGARGCSRGAAGGGRLGSPSGAGGGGDRSGGHSSLSGGNSGSAKTQARAVALKAEYGSAMQRYRCAWRHCPPSGVHEKHAT